MITRIEHLGIAVHSVQDGEDLFTKLLGIRPYKKEVVDSEKVSTSFFQVGESQVELLAPTEEESVIQKYLSKRGPGLHHVAFYTDDLEEEITRLKREGFRFISEKPKDGADNKRIAFLHPKDTGGLLVELCQEKEQL
jgi:methylmalonyl-CoA/ethylmalonyl-CoA epimerase